MILNQMQVSKYSFAFLLVVTIVLSLIFSQQHSFAQFIPVPPPGPPGPTNSQGQAISANSSVPTIEFITPTLKEGKNVFSVKVVGNAPIDYVQIKVASNGKITASKMAQESGNVYKMLLDAQGPSKVIVIRAFDTNGLYAEGVKIYDVEGTPDLLGSIKNFFGGIIPSG